MSHLSHTPIPGSNVSMVVLSEADLDPGELSIGGAYSTPADRFREEMCSAGWTYLPNRDVAAQDPVTGAWTYTEYYRKGPE